MAKNKKFLQEDLNKFKSLLNYDEAKGLVTEKVGPNRSEYFKGMVNEADPEEEETDNPDFDFGGDEASDEASDEAGDEAGEDFDFGDEGGEDFGDLEGEEGEEEGGEEIEFEEPGEEPEA